MLTTITTAIAQNVILGWLWRRAQELAGLGSIVVPIYLNMSPHMQQDVQAIFTGQGGGLTISAAIGIAWYLWAQFQSLRATIKPAVVTTEGRKLPLSKVGSKEAEAIAEIAPPRPKSVADRLIKRFSR